MFNLSILWGSLQMCGTMYFTYPNGGKAIVDEAIEKSIQKTRENDV